MPPRNSGCGASMRNCLGQKCIPSQRVGLRCFARVHVWLACEPRDIDEEFGLLLAQEAQQSFELRVIKFLARNSFIGVAALGQMTRESLAYVAAGAEKQNHAGASRWASSTTFCRY